MREVHLKKYTIYKRKGGFIYDFSVDGQINRTSP